ncbi:hypothetical protein LL963_13145 [Xanthomonas campestris pv. esculenti]|nr:hypothetical protein [Xanthomonas campestris pv. esculenti]
MSRTIAGLMLAIAMATPASVNASQTPLPPEIVDRDVIPAGQVTPPCISLATEAVSISVPTATLQAMVPGYPSARWLLDLPGTVTDARGCESSPVAHAHRASQLLIGKLLEDGIAAVWLHDQPGFVSSVRVRDYNHGCGRGPLGSSSYRVPNGPTVLLLITCTR